MDERELAQRKNRGGTEALVGVRAPKRQRRGGHRQSRGHIGRVDGQLATLSDRAVSSMPGSRVRAVFGLGQRGKR